MVLMISSMSSPMSTFSIKKTDDDLSEEVVDVSGATAFLLRCTEGMMTPLWDGAATWSKLRTERVVDGLLITVVTGATVR